MTLSSQNLPAERIMPFPLEQVIATIELEVRHLQVPVVDLIATQTKDPFKVLVATILSARTKDEVTAAAATRLFSRAATIEDLTRLSVQELEKLIYPVGFFRNKAKYLSTLPDALNNHFDGTVPGDIESLLTSTRCWTKNRQPRGRRCL